MTTKCLFQLTIPIAKLEKVQRDLSWHFGDNNHGVNAVDRENGIVHAWVETESPRITPAEQKVIGAYITSHEYPYED